MSTAEPAGADEEWELGCSDEELAGAGEPDPAGLEALYSAIEAGGGSLALHWACPGRRAPSPPRAAPPRAALATRAPHAPHTPHTPHDEKSDFDFMDEMSSLHLRVRREGEDTLRGSAKKKTTSFDGILSNMIRHKRIEQMEKDAASPVSSPGGSASGTPTTTGS